MVPMELPGEIVPALTRSPEIVPLPASAPRLVTLPAMTPLLLSAPALVTVAAMVLPALLLSALCALTLTFAADRPALIDAAPCWRLKLPPLPRLTGALKA